MTDMFPESPKSALRIRDRPWKHVDARKTSLLVGLLSGRSSLGFTHRVAHFATAVVTR